MSLDNTHHVTNYNPSHWLELYVPQNVVHLTYVPQVPQVWYTCGTEYSPTQDTHFCGVFEKKMENLTTPIFLVGLIYRWGKGPKTKNICINVTFSCTICEK